MKIFLLAPKGSVVCHDCHKPALIEVNLGSHRPPLRLCEHDLAYLIRVGTHRLEQIRSGAEIPKRREEDDSRGNR